VLLYLALLLREGLATSTVKAVAAVIAKGHKLSGHASPTQDPIVRRWRQRIVRISRERRIKSLSPDQMRQIVEAVGDDLIDLRDRALLLVAYALKLRRSTLVSLNVEDVLVVPNGLELTVQGRQVLMPRDNHQQTCPVRALQTWIEVAALPPGPLFVQITRWGRPGGRLSGSAVNVILRSRAGDAGLDLKGISADSLHVTARAAPRTVVSYSSDEEKP
jgi:integrase